MLKNWTVITQPVKDGSNGIISREKYLTSKIHPNHSRTEKILNLIGNESTTKRIIIAGEKHRLRQKLRSERRGRPLASFAMEFCLTLPKTYRPTREQWQSIVADCCRSLACHLNLKDDEKKIFFNQVRAVCHQQLQKGHRGAGDHVHLIVSKIINGKVLTELQKKKTTRVLKQAFTTSTATHLGISIDEYKPSELDKGHRLEKWMYESSKLEIANTEQDKLQKKLENQIKKWEEALKMADLKQIKRQKNRINKSLLQLESITTNRNLHIGES
ncbi:hypothetical protein AB6C44_11720 [Vibrio splendidus]